MTTGTTMITGIGVITDGMGNESMDADYFNNRYEASKMDHPLVAKAYCCINCTAHMICIAVKTQPGFSFSQTKAQFKDHAVAMSSIPPTSQGLKFKTIVFISGKTISTEECFPIPSMANYQKC